MKYSNHFTVVVTLFCGFLLSIIAVVGSEPICDKAQETCLQRAGSRAVAELAGSLEDQLRSLATLANDVAQAEKNDQLTAARFAELAEAITAQPYVYSVEWMPIVQPSERAAVESKLLQEYGKAIPLKTFRHGGIKVIPKNEVANPTLFAHPQNEHTDERIGFQRGRWAAKEFASTWARPYLTPRHQFYSNDIKRLGLFVAAGEISETAKPLDMLFATLDSTFDERLHSTEDTTVTIADITAADYWPNAADTETDRTLHLVESNPAAYVARQQIGGRLFEFTATEDLNAHFRPTWIPWTLFLVCNGVAFFVGMRIYRRESVTLQAQNQTLQQENEKRIATQRRLEELLVFRDQERELIAHEIHDGFVQDIIGAQMFVEAMRAQVSANQPASQKQISTVADLLAKAIGESRQTIDSLKPKVVDEIGLVAAVQAAIAEDLEHYDFQAEFKVAADFPRLPLLVERIVYRMVREGLVNARQHSGANTAQVHLRANDDTVVVTITDQGCGFDTNAPHTKECFGLSGLHRRAEMISGTFSISSNPTDGTTIRIEVPRNLDLQPAPPIHLIDTSP